MSMAVAVLLGVIVGAFVLAIAVYTALRSRGAPPVVTPEVLRVATDMGVMRSQVETMAQNQAGLQQTLSLLQDAISGVATKVTDEAAGVRRDLQGDLQSAKETIAAVRTATEARQRLEDELQQAMRRIEAVIAGHERRGEAGEQILASALREFPAGMIDLDYKVNGKTVEFALVLPGGRRLPIDSKQVAADLLQRLAETPKGPEREELATEIERAVLHRVREVAKYIHPPDTLAWAVAAVPDPAYGACRKAHLEAHKAGVVLIPYSLCVPYVLTVYRLYLQTVSSVNLERLNDALTQIERHVGDLDRILENSVARALTMLQNAYGDLKRPVGAIRGEVAGLRMPVPPAEDVLWGEGSHEESVRAIPGENAA